VLNKQVTNRLLIHIAGKKFGHFAVLEHLGLKSGRCYRIPVIAEPLADGFVIALTYGKKVNWYANILASGGCRLRWKERDYALFNPQLIEAEAGLRAFPAFLRFLLRRRGIQFYLKLDPPAYGA